MTKIIDNFLDNDYFLKLNNLVTSYDLPWYFQNDINDEQSKDDLYFYFTHIQRTVKSNGLFACFNRYHKKSNSDEDIVLKDYPFDEFWKPIISQTSIVQNHIHDLIIKRQTGKSDFHIQDMLRSVPPF